MFCNRTLGLILLGLVLLTVNNKAQVSANDAVYGRSMSGVIGYTTGVNLNSVADTQIPVKASKYIVRRLTVTNCSATPVLAQLALYTGAGATGTTVVSAAVLTTLTGATKFLDMTLALTTDVLTAATLYARNTVVQGTALTCDVYVQGDVLP